MTSLRPKPARRHNGHTKKRIHTIISVSGGRKFISEKRYELLVALLVVLAAAFAGICLYGFMENGQTEKLGCIEELLKGAERSLSSLFFALCISNLIWLFLCFLFGLCIVGAPFILFSLFIKTAGMFYTGNYLYCVFSAAGWKQYLICFCPGFVLMTAALMMTCTESLYTVSELRSSSLSASRGGERVKLSVYWKRSVIPFLLTVAASFLQAVCLSLPDIRL